MPSPKESLALLAAKREREKKLAGIKLKKWTYAAGEAQLDGKEGPDTDEGYNLSEAADRTAEILCGDIDLAAKRIGLVRITEQEGPALRRQQDHSNRYRDALNKWETEIKELRDRQAKERTALNNEDSEIRSIITTAQDARLELQSLPVSPEEEVERLSIQTELDTVRKEKLTLQQHTRDHATLPGNPQWQDLLEREQRAERRLAWLKAKRMELPDFDLELELLNDADSPENS